MSWARKPTPKIIFTQEDQKMKCMMTNNGIQYGIGLHRTRGRTWIDMRKRLMTSVMMTLLKISDSPDFKTTKRVYGL